ncbi:hypothetical protein ES319_D01G135300v1 [Gossypium barbadense]|uniref:Amino acid transporter transmembrane domain-containing protein n=1 Tax=Gossypium barbadense TaxID=3634 RepID=A0A5J5SN38_GOSBA|nr:hypothetical protein ES319_D01G135300v1 [Gossypium barbadense]
MAKQMQKTSVFIEQSPGDYENGDIQKNLDDDGRPKRTGTWVTASAHIITAVIGSGVLSLAWAIAQLGWVAGPAVLMAFSFITYFTSTLLADCYRAPDPVHGKRNYTYMDVVRAYLGGRKVQLCGLAQYANLVGITIGYTITASISMVAVKRSNCFHKHGHHVKCQTSNYPFMVIFACIQLVLSQIPNFDKLSWLSIVAAIMSFAYSSIGLGLSIAKVAGGEHVRTSLTGVTVGVDVSGSEKVWRTFQAIGDIAFAYAYSTVLIEIQDTIKSSPPENKSMKRASSIGVSTTTLFYVLCGLIGYAAFGNDAPGNFLTGLVWRTAYVIITAVVAMIFPFFNDFLGLIGAGSFWPLTVYFPIEMHIAQSKTPKYSFRWIWLKILSWVCLVISLIAAAGSVQGLIQSLKTYKPFQTQE